MRNWLNEQPAQTLYLSSVTLTELLFGIAALPAGKRKNRLDCDPAGCRTAEPVPEADLGPHPATQGLCAALPDAAALAGALAQLAQLMQPAD